MQDPDGFVVELADTLSGPPVSGGTFELTITDSVQSVTFYKELGFDMKLGAAFNSNQQMASTAGAPGASFRQSAAIVPGTPVRMTLIEFKNIERNRLSGRVQDPGTTVLQLRVRDLAAFTAKLEAAGVPIVGNRRLASQKIALLRDPNNLVIELIQLTHPSTFGY